MKTVLFLDDDLAVLRAVERVLLNEGYRVETFQDAPSMERFVAAEGFPQECMLLLDMRLGEDTGLALWQRLRSRADCPPAVFLSGNARIREAVGAIKEGAVDFVIKPFDNQVLLGAIEMAFESQHGVALREKPEESPIWFNRLTPREREVMTMVGKGLRNAEIADLLRISLRTVKMHRSNIMEKVGVRHQSQLLRHYFENMTA